jgi:hypothetical protein
MVVMNVASAGVLLIQSFHWLLVDGLAIEMDVGYVPLVAGCSVLWGAAIQSVAGGFS